MKLLLGTTNPAKLAEYQKFLRHSNLELLTLQDLRIYDEPLEIGETFAENSLQKARFYAEQTEYPALADDGGLEIDALDGMPGVNSNRWVGLHGTDEDRILKVFRLLEGVPLQKRTARISIVVTVYLPAEREHFAVSGSIEGFIPLKPDSARLTGFPYRSVLFLPEYNKYYIDLSPEEHSRTNHREKACEQLLLKLEPYLT